MTDLDVSRSLMFAGPMEIPWEKLQPETLRAVIEEFVSRDGTDYGLKEVSFESKVEEVYKLLRDKKARVVFDAETETCDIREMVRAPDLP